MKNDLTLNAFLSPIPQKDFGDYRKKLDLAKQNWQYLKSKRNQLAAAINRDLEDTPRAAPKKATRQTNANQQKGNKQMKPGSSFSHGSVESNTKEQQNASQKSAQQPVAQQRKGMEEEGSNPYDPNVVPALKRDPFETQEEFVKRLPRRQYYVGDVELLADSYDIVTGKFPVRFVTVRKWAQNLFRPSNLHLLIPREQARALYQKGRAWPTYAWLEVISSQIEIKALRTITPQGEYLLNAFAERDGVYVLYYDGILEDKQTELEWVMGPDKDTTWDEARSWVKSFDLDGGGWTMPTINELKTLYKKGVGHRNRTALLKTAAVWVWAGETQNSSEARLFDFINGKSHWFKRSYSSNGRAFAVRSRIKKEKNYVPAGPVKKQPKQGKNKSKGKNNVYSGPVKNKPKQDKQTDNSTRGF